MAVFWQISYDPSKLFPYYKLLNYLKIMGTCLITNENRNSERQTEFSPTAIRAEIQANLAEGSLPHASLKRFTEDGRTQQPQRVRSVKIAVEGGEEEPQPVPESNGSLRVSESDTGRRAIKHVILPSLKELTYASSLHEQTQKRPPSESASSEDEEEQSESDDSRHAETPQIQTPYQRQELRDMRGQGATDTDNRLIELTINARETLRLNSVKFISGSTYSGDWLAGKRHGQGTLIWADGGRYDGEWRENYCWGFGRLAYCERETYEGEFVRNCREGKGRMISGSNTYEGEWKKDHQEGRGTEKWNGGRYEGQWLNGNKNGYGEIYFEDGSYYKGEFNANQIHGQGKYYWQGSRVYEGQWEHNRMSGEGVLSWNNGEKFEGKFKNDRLHGEAVITYADGSTSQGVFEMGKKHGHFFQTDAEGKMKQMDYFMGKRMKQPEEPYRSITSNTFRSVTTSN